MHGQTWRTLVIRERSQRNARTGSLKYTAILYNVKRQKVWAGYQQHLLQYSSKNSEQNLNQTSAATVAQACECQASTGSSLKANGVCWLGKQSLWESGSCNHLWFLSCLTLVKFSPRNTNDLCRGPPDIQGRAHLPAFVHYALLAWEHLSILLTCLSLLVLPDSGDWKKTKLLFQTVDVSPR